MTIHYGYRMMASSIKLKIDDSHSYLHKESDTPHPGWRLDNLLRLR